MPETLIDCKGLTCPKPVLECRKRLEEERPERVTVVVDNSASQENVSRFLTGKGFKVDVEKDTDGLTRLKGVRPEGPDDGSEVACEVLADAQLAASGAPQQVVVFLSTDALGRGDDALGTKLMQTFLSTLPELGGELWRLILVNGAVRMTTEQSPVIDELRKIEEMGVTILVCGTCLEFFGLIESKAVGQTTNMLDVVTSLQLATKVIQI